MNTLNSPETEVNAREDAGGIPVKRSLAVTFIAFIEAACVVAVAAAKAGLVLGSTAAVLMGWSIALHRDAIRIPVLLVAIVGAATNVYLLWKRWRLRASPASAWRKRPLTPGEKWKMGVVLGLSLLTLAVAAAEIYFHRVLHHTAI